MSYAAPSNPILRMKERVYMKARKSTTSFSVRADQSKAIKKSAASLEPIGERSKSDVRPHRSIIADSSQSPPISASKLTTDDFSKDPDAWHKVVQHRGHGPHRQYLVQPKSSKSEYKRYWVSHKHLLEKFPDILDEYRRQHKKDAPLKTSGEQTVSREVVSDKSHSSQPRSPVSNRGSIFQENDKRIAPDDCIPMAEKSSAGSRRVPEFRCSSSQTDSQLEEYIEKRSQLRSPPKLI